MFQPASVYPARVPAVVESVTAVPAVIEVLEFVVPPFALYERVNVPAVHFAYKIIDAVGV